MDIFRTIIIAAPIIEQARALAAQWPGGVGMYQRALTDDGSTATHYISSGWADDAALAALPHSDWSRDAEGEWVEASHEGNLTGLVAAITPEGGEAPFTVEQLGGMLAYADISTQPPKDAMARLGLEFLD